jgi:hypothetical protein
MQACEPAFISVRAEVMPEFLVHGPHFEWQWSLFSHHNFPEVASRHLAGLLAICKLALLLHTHSLYCPRGHSKMKIWHHQFFCCPYGGSVLSRDKASALTNGLWSPSWLGPAPGQLLPPILNLMSLCGGQLHDLLNDPCFMFLCSVPPHPHWIELVCVAIRILCDFQS